jgi:hypothetical protein
MFAIRSTGREQLTISHVETGTPGGNGNRKDCSAVIADT